jgi:hypothetical protein
MQGLEACELFRFFASEDEKLPGTKWKFGSKTRKAQGSAKIPPKGSGSFAELYVAATLRSLRVKRHDPQRIALL